MLDWVVSGLQWLVEPFDVLTAHQLDVLRTIFGILGTVLSSFGVAATVYARLARRDARTAVEQTRRTEWIDGELRPVSVSEDAHRMTHDLTTVFNDLPKPHGRRRNTPTNQITTYVGDQNE